MNKEMFLKSLQIFSNISEEALKLISSSVEEEKFNDKEVIFYEDTIGEEIFIIFSGQVEIIKNYNKSDQKLLRVLNPKEIFGETGLYSKALRSATAVAKGECIILKIKSDKFTNLFNNYPADGIKIILFLLLNTITRMEQTSKELASIYSISQIMLEAFKNIAEIEDFLKNISYEIANVLPQKYGFGVYLYNKFNEEYRLVFCNNSYFWKTNEVLDKNFFSIIEIKELQEKFIEDKKICICPLIDGKNILGLIIIAQEKNQELEQRYKDLLISISNLVSVSLSGLMFLQEEKEKIKLQNVKTKYTF